MERHTSTFMSFIYTGSRCSSMEPDVLEQHVSTNQTEMTSHILKLNQGHLRFSCMFEKRGPRKQVAADHH